MQALLIDDEIVAVNALKTKGRLVQISCGSGFYRTIHAGSPGNIPAAKD